jgi:hypothetical protein
LHNRIEKIVLINDISEEFSIDLVSDDYIEGGPIVLATQPRL